MTLDSLEGAAENDETKLQRVGTRISQMEARELEVAVERTRSQKAKGLLFFFPGSYEATAEQRTHLLGENPLTIGRVEGDIRIPNGGVSHRHCTVYWKRGELDFVIKDLGSRNGTYVNGGRILRDLEERQLRTGDIVTLGMEVRAYFWKGL
jgi:pSer/pThr/pTyr-binding forkhead associated (FHA) protein